MVKLFVYALKEMGRGIPYALKDSLRLSEGVLLYPKEYTFGYIL